MHERKEREGGGAGGIWAGAGKKTFSISSFYSGAGRQGKGGSGLYPHNEGQGRKGPVPLPPIPMAKDPGKRDRLGKEAVYGEEEAGRGAGINKPQMGPLAS